MTLDGLFREGPAPHGDRAVSPADPDADATLIRAESLALSTRHQQVFGPVDWQVAPGQLGAVVGQQGSGRSSLLLALGGRMRGVTGLLEVSDGERVLDGIAKPRELQRATAVARISHMVELERLLTVGESVDERCITEGITRRAGRERFHTLKQELGLDLDGETLVEELSAPIRTLTTALLACLAPSAYVLLDDADQSLTTEQFAWLVDQLQTLGDLGHVFVISALNTSALPSDAAVLDLDAVASRPEPLLPERRHHVPGRARPLSLADRALEARAVISGARPAHALDAPSPDGTPPSPGGAASTTTSDGSATTDGSSDGAPSTTISKELS